MECKNCHSTWEMGKSASKTYIECPFCGASLADMDKESTGVFDNSKEALAFIMRKHGVDVLLGSTLKDFLPDYAPEIATLRKNVVLSVSLSGAADILKRNMNAGVAEQEIAFGQAVSRVIDTYGTERSLVESVMLEFTEALGWKLTAVTGSSSALKTPNGSAAGEDDTEAVKRCRKAAEQGDADAQCNLGYMYGTGRGVPKDETEAVKWYRKAAEQGDARGQRNLGVMYESGLGVPKDETEAVKWYRKAAEQGNVRGQCNLGVMYMTGRGVPKDETEAVKWYRKAAEQGNARGQCNLGVMYEEYRRMKRKQ